MDKLKVYLKTLKKHHFWVLCGVIMFVSLGTWMKASGDMETQFKRDQTTIKSVNNALDVLGDASPNATYADGLNSEEKTLRNKVFEAWKIFGKGQREK